MWKPSWKCSRDSRPSVNWAYLRVAALLPLIVAMGAALATGAVMALHLNRQGGSSKVALRRLLGSMAVAFPIAFCLFGAWEGRTTLRGLVHVGLGRPQDQRAMGQLRSHGEGFLKKDPAKAVQWYQKAAVGGDSDAQLMLARALLHGQGTVRDPAGALRWAQAAAGQGHPDAMVFAGDLLAPADPLAAEARYQQALATYQKRAQHRDAEACLAYGMLLCFGKGTAIDPIEGFAWMLTARRVGLSPFLGVITQLQEASLTPLQRAEASRRADALLPTLGR